MKYVIWNKTKDQFWYDGKRHNEPKGQWSNQYYATKYSFEELEAVDKSTWFGIDGDVVLAVIALNM